MGQGTTLSHFRIIRYRSMSFFRYNAIAMLAGFVLDLLIGDPEGWPHPVIWIESISAWLTVRSGRARTATA